MVPLPLLVLRQFSQVPPPELPPDADGDSRAPVIIAGNAICQAIGTLFFLARVYSRVILIGSWEREDTALVLAWVLALANSIMQYVQVDLGAGQHLSWMLAHEPSDLVASQKFAYVSQLLVLGALALPKLSICLTYLRIFCPSNDDWGRRAIKGLIVVLLVPLIPFFWLSIFQCKPISAYWDEGRPASKCYEDISGLYANGALNVFVDMALIVIVLPRVLQLHLNLRQKWMLVGIVTLGFLAAIAGAVRVTRVGTTVTKANFDATWDMYDISTWTSIEIYVSLICASAPGCKPLVSKLLPKLLGSSLASHESTTWIQSFPPGSVELNLSKQRRETIGSARVRRNTHDSILEEAEGPYTEFGRGLDSASFDGHSKDEDDDRMSKISETSVSVVQHTDAR
ncbi:hypothetical protein CC80DRAFT_539442 [Byssothecium circinans]|uniref:Rhodopsin domain-containing protein n=1 Tax=Byssothecium circinans TaxID=147558 RepID=A0A6A5TGD2_9PLEO|nr:hypothetical protein CC80DRAFT_539442 [Byssothecium circinans]